MAAPAPDSDFAKDLRDLHLVYDYNVQDAHGNPDKWRYEIWFFSEDRVVYKIHGGPMAGRSNFQTCRFQCIRPGELWQCNFLEETGSVASLVYDIPKKRITTMVAFSKGMMVSVRFVSFEQNKQANQVDADEADFEGHWENADAAHGDKQNAADFERWRGLARIGIQTDRHMLAEQADIVDVFRGKGDLEPIEQSWPTL